MEDAWRKAKRALGLGLCVHVPEAEEEGGLLERAAEAAAGGGEAGRVPGRGRGDGGAGFGAGAVGRSGAAAAPRRGAEVQVGEQPILL